MFSNGLYVSAKMMLTQASNDLDAIKKQGNEGKTSAFDFMIGKQNSMTDGRLSDDAMSIERGKSSSINEPTSPTGSTKSASILIFNLNLN